MVPYLILKSETAKKGDAKTDMPMQENGYAADENQIFEESKMIPANNMG